MSTRQSVPPSVQISTSCSVIATAQVNVTSTRSPRRQLRPAKGVGPALEDGSMGYRSRDLLLGEACSCPGNCHILTCRVPAVMGLRPHHVIWQILVVHLFVAQSFTAPVFEFTLQMNRKPSFISPSVARKLESGLKAAHFTPQVWSLMMASGVSVLASFAVAYRSTRGLYPVSPTARNLPFGLSETHLTDFILSLADHVFAFSSSGNVRFGVMFSCSFFGVAKADRLREGVEVGVE